MAEPPRKKTKREEDKEGGRQNGSSKLDNGQNGKAKLSLEMLKKAKQALLLQKQGLKQKGLVPKVDGATKNQGVASIASRVGKSAGIRSSKPAPLRLDKQGREVDEDGNVIESASIKPIFKVSSTEQKVDKDEQEVKVEKDESRFIDPDMPSSSGASRKKRPTFEFIREGKYQRMAQRRRMKSHFAELGHKSLGKDEDGEKETKIANPNLIPLGVRDDLEEKPTTSETEELKIEWWDSAIVSNGEYDPECTNINLVKITPYVQHPVPIQPPAEQPAPPPQPLKLTRKEQKKLRTQQRQAREKEKQEMIRQGLLEPPKPKVKISNLVRVLGADATQDPTKIEREVRAQMEERQQAHEDRNLARKLTPAERREKKMRKMFDPEKGIFLALFKVQHLQNAQHKFKIDVNAEENMLTGCVLTSDKFTLVVVEGCSKSIIRYKKLMLKRIDWNACLPGEEQEGQRENSCKLLWEGSIESTHFKRFRQEVQKTNQASRKYLADFGLEHLWDLACKDDES